MVELLDSAVRRVDMILLQTDRGDGDIVALEGMRQWEGKTGIVMGGSFGGDVIPEDVVVDGYIMRCGAVVVEWCG